MLAMTEESTPKRQLPEDRQFRCVLIGCCIAAALFIAAFVTITLVVASRELGLVDSGWYEAWGSWAGGAATAAAFLIAAFSIRVSSAHEHADRQEAARIRENNDMAQARLLVIYKVEMPDGVESLATFRIENRSKDVFFDVSVPFVDAPCDSDTGYERRTPDLVEAENRLHEIIPTAELLTAYRSHNEHEAWFTLVTVHTADWRGVKFAVEYTDAGGRRWRQHLGGSIEPIYTTEAIPVREADRFQPRQQIRRVSSVEAHRAGGRFAEGHIPPESDEEFLEVLQVPTVARWKRIELVGDPVVRSGEDTPGEVEVTVKFAPAGPPFWKDHFRKKLDQNGFRFTSGNSGGRGETQTLRCPEDAAARVSDLLTEAIKYANDEFEEHELAAARRAIAARKSGRQT
jgi:hypothetical protein